MVVRLEGKVDGNPVIFTWVEGDLWQADVPFDRDGSYIVELTAYDDAGNVGYKTTVLITFDMANMRITIEPFPWRADLQPCIWGSQLLPCVWRTECEVV